MSRTAGRDMRRQGHEMAAGMTAADGTCRVVVLADTHLRATPGGRDLPAPVLAELASADAVLHAGDILEQSVLDRLAAFAPTCAVLGNNDVPLVGTLPEVRTLELAGVRIGMIHDGGARQGRAARLHRRFPDCQLVVFGHSHAPCDEVGVDGQLLFNPGSPTQRRAQPHPSFGRLELSGGRILCRRIVVLDGAPT